MVHYIFPSVKSNLKLERLSGKAPKAVWNGILLKQDRRPINFLNISNVLGVVSAGILAMRPTIPPSVLSD